MIQAPAQIGSSVRPKQAFSAKSKTTGKVRSFINLSHKAKKLLNKRGNEQLSGFFVQSVVDNQKLHYLRIHRNCIKLTGWSETKSESFLQNWSILSPELVAKLKRSNKRIECEISQRQNNSCVESHEFWINQPRVPFNFRWPFHNLVTRIFVTRYKVKRW